MTVKKIIIVILILSVLFNKFSYLYKFYELNNVSKKTNILVKGGQIYEK